MIPWRKGLPPRALLRAHLQADPCDPAEEVAVFDVQDHGMLARVYAAFTSDALVWTVRPNVKSTLPHGGIPVAPPSASARFRPVDVTSGEPRPWQDPPSGLVRAVLEGARRKGGSFRFWGHPGPNGEAAETAVTRGWLVVQGKDYQLTDDGRAALARVKAEEAAPSTEPTPERTAETVKDHKDSYESKEHRSEYSEYSSFSGVCRSCGGKGCGHCGEQGGSSW